MTLTEPSSWILPISTRDIISRHGNYMELIMIVFNFRTCQQTSFNSCRLVVVTNTWLYSAVGSKLLNIEGGMALPRVLAENFANLNSDILICSNTGSIRDDSYWTSRKNSLELIELSNIIKVSLI
jgi:hypothetical protein